MKEHFPRQEFQRLGFSEPAIRLLERLADIKEIGTRAASMEAAINKLVKKLPIDAKEAVDAATAAAGALMNDIAPVIVNAAHTGTVETGQLPRNVLAKRYAGTEDVTTLSSWSASTDSGSITYTIGAATGVLNITALGASSVVTITSVHNGVSLSKKVTVTKNLAAAPATGSGGGTSASDTTFNSFNSTTHATVSDVLTVTVGSTGQVALSAPLGVTTAAEAPSSAGLDVKGIWQHDTTGGGVWADLGTEASSDPDVVVQFDSEISAYTVDAGSISVSHTITGLAASSSQKFRLNFRNNSGTRVMYLSGTASAVGS